jgi:hypothetical protein
MLVLLMGIGSVVMWIGIPLALIYAASQLADTSSPTFGPYLLVFLGLPVGMAIMAKLLGSRGSTRKRGVLDTVMIVSVGVALLGFGLWFFVFAGSSLPGG